MKILHLSTWEEVCGIATYARNLVKHLDEQGIYNEVYPVNKLEQKYLSLEEIRNYFSSFCKKAQDFDIVHIQHEHSFFHGSYAFGTAIDIFYEILLSLKKQKKKVFVTFHTEPVFCKSLYLTLSNLNKHNVSDFFQTLKWKQKIAPFFQGRQDSFTAMLHTRKSRLSFLKSGFSESSIKIVKHGLVQRDSSYYLEEGTNSKAKINLPEDSKLLSMFGFISSYKGYKVAIEALNYLPDNYYLALVGGLHPATNDLTLDQVLKTLELREISTVSSSLKLKDNLKNRVLVTGFVDFNTLNLFQAATDICLAPYLSAELSASGALTWALTSGRPTIASRIPAFCELNEESNCMLLVTPEAPNELAWQVLNLVKNEALQEELVTNALNYASQNSWNKISSTLIEIYKESLKK